MSEDDLLEHIHFTQMQTGVYFNSREGVRVHDQGLLDLILTNEDYAPNCD